MLNKIVKRRRRAVKARMIIRKSGRPHICLHRSLKHFYAQLIMPGDKGDRTIASASSLDKEVKASGLTANNIALAKKVGEVLAQRIVTLNIKKVALGRSGYQYHSRLKAFKEAVQSIGLVF